MLKSLRGRFLAALIFLGIVPLGALGLVVDHRVGETLVRHAFQEIDTVALFKAEQLQAWTRARQEDVVRPATIPVIRRRLAILVGDRSPRQAEAASEIRDILEGIRSRQGFAEMFVLDGHDASVVLSTDPEQEGKFKDDRPYFREGRKAPFTQHVYYSLAHGKPVITFAAPVRDAAGQAIAVIVGRVDLDFIDRIMEQRVGLPVSGRSFLVNRFNYFVSDTLGRGPEGWRPVFSEGVTRALAGRTGTAVYQSHDGERVVGSHRWLPDLGLALLVETDHRAVMAPAWQFRVAVLGTLGLVAALAVMASLVFAWEISRPLSRLVAGARTIGSGDLTHRVGVTGSTELVTLASAMNRMADDLLASRQAIEAHGQTLEARVQERTSEAEARRRASEALAEVGRHISQSLEPEVVGRLAVESLCGLVNAEMAVLYRLEPASGDLVLVAGVGPHVDWNERLSKGTATVGIAVRERQPVTTPDLLNDSRVSLTPEARGRVEGSGYRAVLAVPLLLKGEAVGALGIGASAGRVFSGEEVRLAQAFGDQVAVALQNAALVTELRTREARLKELLEANHELSAIRPLDEVLSSIAEACGRLLGTSSVGIRVVEGDELVVKATCGDAPQVMLKPRLKFGESLSGFVATTGQPLVLSAFADDPRVLPEHWEAMRRLGHRAWLGVPVKVGERVVGVLSIRTRREQAFTDEDQAMAMAFASQAAVALNNAELYEDARARLEQVRRLARLGQLVTASLDYQRVLDSVAEAALDLLRTDLVRVWVVDEEARVLRLVALRASGGIVDPQMTTTELPLGRGLVGWVVEQKTRRYSAALLADPLQLNKEWVRTMGFVSQLAVPLVVGDRAVGALVVVTKTQRRFSRDEEDLLEAFGATAAAAIENARLYRAAQEAYQELSQKQEQLVQAQKMEAVGRLAGGIAHDFNNLLTVINGRSQLLLRKLPADQPLARDLALIGRTGERAAQLTRQLLAFSRKQVLRPEMLDLNAVVEEMATMLRRLIGEDIRLELELGPALGWVSADPGQVEQIIMNLAVNARDAMPQGGTLRILTADVELPPGLVRERGMAAGAYVLVEIADTGHGMDAEAKARIFEPFFTTKERGRGTGLGLATVYGIVEQSDGCITVDSEPGQGTSFRVYLPRVDEPAAASGGDPPAAPAAGGTETVLLVEDEDEVRALAREALEEQGYTILEASGGDEAIRLSEGYERTIDLLLTDVVLPGMSGPQVAERVGRVRRNLPVVFMSGYTDDAVFGSGLLDKDTPYLEKPFTPERLAGKVREALDAAHNGRTRRGSHVGV